MGKFEEIGRVSKGGENGYPLDRFDYPLTREILKAEVKSESPRSRCTAKDTKKICVILMLTCASCVTFGAGVYLHMADLVNNVVIDNLVVKNDSKLNDWWRNPLMGSLLKVYFFNYTNIASYESGIDKKIHLQEIGPYIYRLKSSKTNLVFDEESKGDIVTFQYNKSSEFIPEKSQGLTEDDVIMSPNLIFLATLSAAHDYHPLLRLTLPGIVNNLPVESFLALRVREMIWGTSKHKPALQPFLIKSILKTDIGILTKENELSQTKISMHTGKNDRNLLGTIAKYNGKETLPFWQGKECNRVDGHEGSMFPHIPAIKKYDPYANPPLRINVFNFQLCRRFPFEQKKSVTSNGFHTTRFEPPADVFDDARKAPENACYCDAKQSVCPPSGVFNSSPCNYGAPVMMSFPHFHLGDPSLREYFEGLNPNEQRHGSYVDIEPNIGVPLKWRSAFQLNIMVRVRKGISAYKSFPPNFILPVLWVEAVEEEMPEHVRNHLKYVLSIYLIEKITIYTLFLASLLFLSILIFILRRRIRIK